MKCSTCEQENTGSRVVLIPSSMTTLLVSHEFWDEEGKHHTHDPNIRTLRFRCSRGHEWTERRREDSCWCGWANRHAD